MKVLLDTATFLWAAADSDRLSQQAREIIEDPGSRVLLSVASAWEISIKFGLGKLKLKMDPAQLVPAIRKSYGIESLTLDEECCLQVGRLPKLHRDPFDRIMISQAIVNGLTLLTPDEMIRRYPVRTIW